MIITFRQFFRLIFTVFFLYFLGDAIFRWDGFSYYATFAEFIPSVALASILWSLVSLCAAFLVWILMRLIAGLCAAAGIHTGMENILVFFCFFMLAGFLVWKGKQSVWPLLHTTLAVKFVVFLCVAFSAAVLAWLFRDRAGRWVKGLMNGITPLVWLFGMIVMLSVPVVAYTVLSGENETAPSLKQSLETAAEDERPDIILVTFDALTAGNMSVYGYPRETTPFISRWARTATVFTGAEAASNFTTPSAASLMTGKRVWTHQTYHIEGSKPVMAGTESLPALLKEHGYYNIALVVNPFASPEVLGISGSFDMAPLPVEFGGSASLFGWKFGIIDKVLYRAFGTRIRLHNWILKNEFILSRFINLVSRNIYLTPVPPERAFNKYLHITKNRRPGPLFAWIHIFPPHDPYLPPEPFMGRFSSSRALRSYKGQEQLIEESYKYLFQHKPYPETMQPAVELMRDYYDEFIAYCDRAFEDFIEELSSSGRGNTVVILTADHGESFEHGYFTHGGPFLFEQVTNIPLIIKIPEQKTGKTFGNRVGQIDIPATILDLAGIDTPAWMEGRSLVPLVQGAAFEPRPVFSVNLQGNRSLDHQVVNGTVAVWDGDYKLIHYLEKEESILFNLKKDPDEGRNIANIESAVSERLLKDIKDRLETINTGRR